MEILKTMANQEKDNNYKEKLRALLEGLETQHVDDLIKRGKVGDFFNYGKAYVNAVRKQIEASSK
jgi:hypothetical protein